MRANFLSGPFRSTRDPIFRMQSGRKTRSADKQDQGSQVFQATIINSSVDQVKEKKIAFLQGNFDMLVFRRIAVLQFTIVIQCVYYHV